MAKQTVDIVGEAPNWKYDPAKKPVGAGDTVTWHNQTTATHTATSDKGDWDTGDIKPGGHSKEIEFKEKGLQRYHCSHHPTMKGAVEVT
jgi:plastocyanin